MPPSQPENRLLTSLPHAEFARLTAGMTDVTFGHKETAYRAGGPIEYVYFPRAGVLSAVVVMADGSSAEVGLIGSEGVTGAAAYLGTTRSTEQVFCQIAPAPCRRMPVRAFVAEAAAGPFREAVLRYLRGSLTVASRVAACNSVHPSDERLARWLLMSHDRVNADEFTMTHEFMAIMLGVRRATVTVTAGTLQSAGLITYRHGKVKVLDRAGLEEAACECYAAIRDATGPTGD
jgi:CRP-like cAMP-binding protein